MDLQKLKSGSDLRGLAIGENAVMTEEAASYAAYAFTRLISQKTGKPFSQITIALGKDSRISGDALMNAAQRIILQIGANVCNYGLCTTPAMYMSILTKGYEPDGAIMFTASHHPWNMNGMKFFLPDGGIGHEELAELVRLSDAEIPVSSEPGKLQMKPFLPAYTAQLKKLISDTLELDIQKPLLGLHVVVDAGNGAGGFYAKMLEELGAWIEGSQFLEPDGHFPNHIPNPENPEAMASISSAVLRVGADLGIIFDADCDRAAIVDETGKEINRNRLIAMISAILLDETPGATIVTDSVTSSGLTDFIKAWGGEHYRFKRGYRNVIDEAIRLNQAGIDCPLAIETSGHAALRKNHFLDDGMYLVTLLVCRAYALKQQGKKLGALLEDLREPVESIEIRLPLLCEDFSSVAKSIIENLLDYASNHPEWHIAPDNREGVRIFFDAGGELNSAWFLLRLSVHDPVIPINSESDVSGGVQYALAQLYDAIKEYREIDLLPLQKAMIESI